MQVNNILSNNQPYFGAKIKIFNLREKFSNLRVVKIYNYKTMPLYQLIKKYN